MTALNSSWITDATLNDGVLTLTMNGRNYDYPDPGGSLYAGITSAASAGDYYNRHVKGRSVAGNALGSTARAGLISAGRMLVSRGFMR